MKILKSGDTLDDMRIQTIQILDKDTNIYHRNAQGMITLQPGIYRVQAMPDIKKDEEVYSNIEIWRER